MILERINLEGKDDGVPCLPRNQCFKIAVEVGLVVRVIADNSDRLSNKEVKPVTSSSEITY